MNTPEKLRRVDELTDDNFKRVFDVAFDIHEQLNLASNTTVVIAATKRKVKFGLLPDLSRPSLDDYENGREQACGFLQNVGALSKCTKLNQSGQRVWRKFEVKVNRDVFDKVFEMLESRYSRLTQHKAPAATAPRALSYDAATNLLRYGDKTISIRNNSLQHFTCLLAFKNLGGKVKEIDIIDEHDEAKGTKTSDRNRVIYDVHKALNSKTEKYFDIKPFKYESAEVWVDFIHTTPVE